MSGQQNNAGDAFSRQLDEVRHAKDELQRNRSTVSGPPGPSRRPGGQGPGRIVSAAQHTHNNVLQQPTMSQGGSSTRNIWNEQRTPTSGSSFVNNNRGQQQPVASERSVPRHNVWGQQAPIPTGTALVKYNGGSQQPATNPSGFPGHSIRNQQSLDPSGLPSNSAEGHQPGVNPFSTSLVNSSSGWQPATSSSSLSRHHIRDQQGVIATGTSFLNSSRSQQPRTYNPSDHTQPLGIPDRDTRPPPLPASTVFRQACDNCIQENIDCDIGRPECNVCFKKGLECRYNPL